MDGYIQEIPNGEKIFLGEELNVLIGKDSQYHHKEKKNPPLLVNSFKQSYKGLQASQNIYTNTTWIKSFI